MVEKLSWEYVLKCIIGGEIKWYLDGCIFRGQIKSVELGKETVCIKMEWTEQAQVNGRPGFDKWKPCTAKTVFADRGTLPEDIGYGGFQFKMDQVFYTVSSGRKFDPAKVEGLVHVSDI